MSIDLFAPCRVSNVELRNRFVRSATRNGSADGSGAATDASVDIIRELACGGVGLIVTGYAYVSSLGQAALGHYGIHTDEMLPGLRRMVQAAHEGGARIAVQIAHGGINSHYPAEKGIQILAVSNRPDTRTGHHEMSDEEIEGIISDFAAAAVRAREAGFDAVQLHGAHGYLMSQFLSPLYNRRTDEWGGTPENRRRFHLEVTRRVRQTVGPDLPVMIKLGIHDSDPQGLSLTEGLHTARELAAAGIDAIEVSAGVGNPMQTQGDGEPERPYFREQSAALKRELNVPIIEGGGIRSLEMAQSIVDGGNADLISMCRPFIREPDLVLRWQNGDRDPAKCISCNRCYGIVVRERRMECAQERALRQQEGSGP